MTDTLRSRLIALADESQPPAATYTRRDANRNIAIAAARMALEECEELALGESDEMASRGWNGACACIVDTIRALAAGLDNG